ncbi:sperm flagellar protein 1-like isoform X1 [Mizuhopecten yessoensis]|uniref:sperm flagellar protein 1-like isoform X1 n=1 Tax=Mizuhopecten yessoensis TaxID=6573 RepID=UPI000B45A753|nr:sperm flagellar protein 1-like isoform X1 [Mizuhopecten yessoensis]
MELNDDELTDLYKWVDAIPLSKPKKNMTRDFADGVCVAEILKYYFPKIVELHTISQCSKTHLKIQNWLMLNRTVFSKLRFELASDVIEDLSTCKPGVIEKVLHKLRSKIDSALWHMKNNPRRESDKPEADQVYNHYASIRTDPYQGKTVKVPVLEPYDPYNDSPNRKGTNRHRSPTRGCPSSSDETHSDDGTLSLSQWSEPIVPYHMTTAGPPRPTVPYYSGPDSEAVSSLMFEEKVQESMSKDETIQILQAKIQRLEHLLHLKDLKINTLQDHLDELRPTVQTKKRSQNFR